MSKNRINPQIAKKAIAKAMGLQENDCVVSLNIKALQDIKNGKINKIIKSFRVDSKFSIVQSMCIELINQNKDFDYIKDIQADVQEIIITRDSIIINEQELNNDDKNVLAKALGYNKESDIYKAYKSQLESKTRYKAYLINIKSFR